MTKPLKYATLAQAQQQLDANSFVYHNPCCVCHKECSTPTMEIWLRRIAEFGSVAAMYNSYTCRKCRKGDVVHKAADAIAKADAPAPTIIATEPLPHTMAGAPMMKKKQERPLIQVKPVKVEPKPGDAVKAPAGCYGFSVWEDGVFRGTTWHKIVDKKS